MVNANYVRVGRLVRILRGPRQDKVGVILDIVDANRAIVANPTDPKMWRHVQNLKNVEPLKFAVPISRNAGKKEVATALTTKKSLEKWGKTKKAAKIAATSALANSTDFERYQLRVAKRSLSFWTRKMFDESDKKKPVSQRAVILKKLQKRAAKYDAKNAARIGKAVAKKAAKKQKYETRKAKKAAAQ